MYKYKLGECINEVIDKTTKNNQYEVLSVTKDGIYSQEEFFNKQIASENNIGYKIIRKNNLVFSTMNLWMGSLDVLTNYQIGIVSPAYKIFKFNEDKMIPAFGKYFMKSHMMLERYKDCSEQGASIVRRNLDLNQLLETEIIIPSVVEQKKIVKILENNDKVIDEYDKLIKEKEQFIKSQFVEMFGNPITNNKKWKRNKGKELFIFSSGKGNPTKNLNDNNEFPCYGGNGITGYSKEYLIDYDTLVIGRVGAYCGSVHRTINKVWITDNAIYIKQFKGRFNLKFLEQLLLKIDIHSFANATGQPKITQEPLERFEYIEPPLVLQNEFDKIAQLIDKQKFELEKQKENYIELKKGLMQQLLTGKLKVN